MPTAVSSQMSSPCSMNSALLSAVATPGVDAPVTVVTGASESSSPPPATATPIKTRTSTIARTATRRLRA